MKKLNAILLLVFGLMISLNATAQEQITWMKFEEAIAANAAYYAAKDGRIKPGTSNAAGWYRGLVSYILD